MSLAPPEPLQPHHDLTRFTSGNPIVDRWVGRHARANAAQALGVLRVVAEAQTQRVVGLYALTFKTVVRDGLPRGDRRNMPPEVPAFFIGRFAVDREYRGHGIGRGLLRDLYRFIVDQQLPRIPAPFLYLDADDEDAGAFWRHLGFTPCPALGETAHLLRIKDLLATMGIRLGDVLPGGRGR